METTDTTFTKIINGETHTYTRAQVHLHGKIHDAHPARTVRNGAGERVAQPLCGQQSRRFYPGYILVGHETTCEKCLAARPTTGPTAVRTVEAGKATITVTFPGSWPPQTLGGARAARAAVVLIVDQGGEPPKVMCRADAAAARVEADRMTRGGPSSTRFGAVTMPAQPTVAIPVTDACASTFFDATCREVGPHVHHRGWRPDETEADAQLWTDADV